MQVETETELSSYQKYKGTHTKCALKYRTDNRDQINEKQRNKYWDNEDVRQRKLEMMRLYRLKKKEQKLAEAKAQAEERGEIVEEASLEEIQAKNQRIISNRAKKENRKKFMREVKASQK